MFRVIFGVVASLLLIPGIALAEFVYTGVEVGFVDVEYDTGAGTLLEACSGPFADRRTTSNVNETSPPSSPPVGHSCRSRSNTATTSTKRCWASST